MKHWYILNLKSILLSEINQPLKSIYCRTLLMWSSRRDAVICGHRSEKSGCLTQGRSLTGKGYRELSRVVEKTQILIVIVWREMLTGRGHSGTLCGNRNVYVFFEVVKTHWTEHVRMMYILYVNYTPIQKNLYKNIK